MEPQNFLILAGLLLAVSICLNVFLFFRMRRKSPRSQSVELQEFVADLMHGKLGMIAVARVNPDDILLRSPKR